MAQIRRWAALFALVATGFAVPGAAYAPTSVQAQERRNFGSESRNQGDYNEEWRRGGRGFERRPPDQDGAAEHEADEGEAPGCVFRPRTLELLV